MTATEIVKATAEHVQRLELRTLDVEACKRLGHAKALDGVLWSLEHSDDARSLLYGPRPYCIAGVMRISMVPNLAQLWCATSSEAKHHPRDMCEIGRRCVEHWLTKYEALFAWVDSQDDGAQRWVSWLGMRFGPTGWDAPNGHRFLVAVRGRA